MDPIFSIDWISGTYPTDEGAVAEVAGEVIAAHGGGTPVPVARYGYTQAVAVYGTGRVMWRADRSDMGVHVELPSSALAELGSELQEYIMGGLAQGVKFSRLDIACDTDAVSVDEIVQMDDDGLLVTNLRANRLIVDRQTGAKTLYLGGATPGGKKANGVQRSGTATRRMVRVYDKGIESGKASMPGTLTRIEVQLRAEYARAAAMAIAAGDNLDRLIVGAIDFRDRPELHNITERPRMAWWAAILGDARKIKLSRRPLVENLDRAVGWVDHQVAVTMAKISIAFGGTDWLDAILESGVKRLRPPQVAQAHRWGDAWAAIA